MRVIATMLILTLGWATPATATGGFGCTIANKLVRFSGEGLFTRGLGEGVQDFNGRLDLLSTDLPDDLRSTELGRDQLTQRWLHGRDIKLRIYRELEGEGRHGSAELIIETRQSPRDELTFVGTYELTVFYIGAERTAHGKTIVLRGKAICTAG